MMDVRMCSVAAPGPAPNEDACIALDGLVAVLDGVTEAPGLENGCRHGTAWYTRRLATRLVQAYLAAPAGSPADLLATAIADVRADHGGRCDLGRPNTPAASVAVLRADGEHADYLVLCDATVVLDTGGGVEAVTDGRLAATIDVLRREPQPGGLDPDAVRRRHARAKWPHVNTPGGYWIAAATPEAAGHALTGAVPVRGPGGLRRAALLTDGAARAVDVFGLTDWPGVLGVLDTHGPAHLIRQVRRCEYRAARNGGPPAGKPHDDATAALCAFAAHSTAVSVHGEETT